MIKDAEAGSGGCSGIASRPQRLLPRFSLRRLLYSSPFFARRAPRPSTANINRNAKGNKEQLFNTQNSVVVFMIIDY